MAHRRGSGFSHRRAVLLRWCAGILLALAAAAVLADHLGWFGGHEDDIRRYDRTQALVIRIVDGDTAVVRTRSDGREVLIHLLGVDAPDLHFSQDQPQEYWASQARDYLVEKLKNRTLTLHLEPLLPRDRFDRLLVYAYLSDADNFNVDLVRDGYAYADRRVRHSLSAVMEAAEAEARQRRRGLWRAVTVSQMPRWRQDWLVELKKSNKEP